MSLTSGRMAQFTFLFALPVGVSEETFKAMVEAGVSANGTMLKYLRGGVFQVVPEPMAPPNLSL